MTALQENFHIVHILLSDSWGGLEIYSLDFIAKLRSAGLHSSLLCKPNTPVHSGALARQIPLVDSQALRAKTTTHLHVHKRQNLPWVRWQIIGRDLPVFYSLYMSSRPKKDPYHRWIYSRLSGLASSAAWVCHRVEKDYPLAPNKVHLIRYGRNPAPIGLSPTERNSFRQSQGANPQQRVLLSLSRIDPGKGVGELVRAFAGLPVALRSQWQLWIVGDPSRQGTTPSGEPVFEPASVELLRVLQLQCQSPELQKHIRLFSFQNNPLPFLLSADLFFMGALEETYSLAVIDAMLSGLPILGAHSGGTIEQIGNQEERGFFFRTDSLTDLQDQLTRLSEESHDKFAEKGQVARSWAQSQHSWDTCIGHWKELYVQSQMQGT